MVIFFRDGHIIKFLMISNDDISNLCTMHYWILSIIHSSILFPSDSFSSIVQSECGP